MFNFSRPSCNSLIHNSPALFSLGFPQFLTPYLIKIGTPRFRRWVVDNLLLNSKIQHLKGIVDLTYNNAKDLLEKKRLALKEGDEAMMQQIGEGKDIMSILCEHHYFYV